MADVFLKQRIIEDNVPIAHIDASTGKVTYTQGQETIEVNNPKLLVLSNSRYSSFNPDHIIKGRLRKISLPTLKNFIQNL